MRSLILAIMVCSGLSVHAQSDTILPNVYGEWYVEEYNWSGGTPILHSQYNYIIGQGWPGTFSYDGYEWNVLWDDMIGSMIGGLRVENAIVHYLEITPQLDSIEHVLYDFNVGIGDTAYIEMGNGPVIVTDKYNVTLNGRIRWRYEMNNNDIWTTGMGSHEGLFRRWCSTFESYYTQLFSGNYIDQLGTPYFYSWGYQTGTEEHDPGHMPFLFPNPNQGTFTLSDLPIGKTFKIFDPLGQMISSGIVDSDRITIQLPSGASGTFIVDCEGNHERVVVLDRSN